MNIVENNKLNQIINNYNNNLEPKYSIESKNIIEYNISNNNTLQNILNNSINLNLPIDILSNNIADKLNNNNNLNNNSGKIFINNRYINYLSLIND